jgi:hypothetical protein
VVFPPARVIAGNRAPLIVPDQVESPSQRRLIAITH